MSNGKAKYKKRKDQRSKAKKTSFWLWTFVLHAICILLCRPSYAQRIVSLLPSNTEILEAIGAGNEVVGVTIFESSSATREYVGDLIHPNIEKIVSLKPDLIAGGEWKSSRIMTRLQSMGYKVVEIPNPHSLEELYSGIRLLAKASGRSSQADGVIESMRTRLDALRWDSARYKPLWTYIEVDDGLWTVGGPDFTSEVYAIAGARNIFSDIRKPAAQVSAEAVVTRNPQAVLCLDQSCQEILSRPGWQSIEAIRKKQVVLDIDPNLLSRPSPKLVEGAEALAKRLRQWQTP